MFGQACSTQAFSCTPADNASAKGMKRVRSVLVVEDEVSLEGSEWLREVEDDLDLTDDWSDFIDAEASSILALTQLAVALIDFNVDLDDSLSLTHNFTTAGIGGGGGGGGSVTMEAIFDSNTAAGEVVYVSGDGHVDLAQANNVDTATAVGIATQDVLAGQTGEYIPVGPVTCDTWNLTPGTVYYLDPDTPGAMTTTYPMTSGHFVVILGAAAKSTQLNLEIHWMVEQS